MDRYGGLGSLSPRWGFSLQVDLVQGLTPLATRLDPSGANHIAACQDSTSYRLNSRLCPQADGSNSALLGKPAVAPGTCQ